MAKDGQKETVIVVTEGVVASMISEAIKGLATAESIQLLVTEEQLQKKLAELQKGTITEERAGELFDELFTNSFAQGEELLPYTATLGPVAGAPPQPPVDPAWLKGLSYRDVTQERRLVEGRPRLVPTILERELEPADVMGYRVTDSQVFLVTADGQKCTVEI